MREEKQFLLDEIKDQIDSLWIVRLIMPIKGLKRTR